MNLSSVLKTARKDFVIVPAGIMLAIGAQDVLPMGYMNMFRLSDLIAMPFLLVSTIALLSWAVFLAIRLIRAIRPDIDRHVLYLPIIVLTSLIMCIPGNWWRYGLSPLLVLLYFLFPYCCLRLLVWRLHRRDGQKRSGYFWRSAARSFVFLLPFYSILGWVQFWNTIGSTKKIVLRSTPITDPDLTAISMLILLSFHTIIAALFAPADRRNVDWLWLWVVGLLMAFTHLDFAKAISDPESFFRYAPFFYYFDYDRLPIYHIIFHIGIAGALLALLGHLLLTVSARLFSRYKNGLLTILRWGVKTLMPWVKLIKRPVTWSNRLYHRLFFLKTTDGVGPALEQRTVIPTETAATLSTPRSDRPS